MQDSRMIDFLVKLIQKESVTPNECGIYDLIKDELSDFNIINCDKGGVKNLFLYKDFSKDSSVAKSSKIHLCFAGHIDVVPSGSGWKYPPFGGVIENDILYGRGVVDMKGGIASFIYAIKKIKNFNGILSILLTSDEEGDGIYGTKIMLEHLKSIDLLPDFAIVAEPTSMDILGDTIKIGRRGSINGILKIKGIQGHVAYPQKCINPIDLIAPILPKLSNITFDNGDENFAESRLIITDIRSGMETVNVTPSELKIMFNVRNNPHTNQDSIKQYIASIFGEIPYSLVLKQSSYPFITHSNVLVESLSKAIKDTIGINSIADTSGGTSDARYFSDFGVNVVELGLINKTIHAVDECSKIDDIINLSSIFYYFINDMNKGF
ncbi:succinyl-diaminopimelate desuccinylase [Helicobacter sp. 16-1353]|uniref:succinyl-diaminopimelate desuccinylase n=1 Tax=Helicobacter sp. 16-1353 TaxID=2004996 RepID=UPI000DCB9FE9|nr:succinyl-diaminopimelate desuccinylase [Helicobacter sp. 16-1353]RAX53058.1 succinyl-diaminopimelate desuccinylase [Helicobacter sp. 16-1353]